jgi:hypothetical protein
MRCLALLGVLGLLLAPSLARAQIQVSAQTERTNFLLYERVDLLITIENIGGTDLVLDNNEGHPWLSFLVSKHNHLPVRPERESSFAPVSLKAGAQKTLRVNITPLFAFREEGQYQVETVIDLPGAGQMISSPVPFAVMRGKTVWTQQKPVDSTERTYSLIRFSPDANTTRLYLRVEDPAENLVYANIGLGDLVAYVDPEVNFDPKGNLHILQPVAMETYLYTRTDPDGKILDQNIFKTYQKIPPHLAKVEDGNVTVAGGLEEDPNVPREKLSDTQHDQRAAPVALPVGDDPNVAAPSAVSAVPNAGAGNP